MESDNRCLKKQQAQMLFVASTGGRGVLSAVRSHRRGSRSDIANAVQQGTGSRLSNEISLRCYQICQLA